MAKKSNLALVVGGVAVGAVALYLLSKRVQGACIDGQLQDGTPCYDGSIAWGEECRGGVWVETDYTCPVEPLDGEVRNPVTCWDGSTIYTEMYSRASHSWVASGQVCLVKVCDEGQFYEPYTCWDGSIVYKKVCVNNTLVSSGNMCPASECTPGAVRNPVTCWDGTVVYTQVCQEVNTCGGV